MMNIRRIKRAKQQGTLRTRPAVILLALCLFSFGWAEVEVRAQAIDGPRRNDVRAANPEIKTVIPEFFASFNLE
jgi:hypothetical protein